MTPGPRVDASRPPLDVAQQGRRRAWRVVGPAMALVWLVFLSEPLTSVETESSAVRVLSYVGVLGVAGVFAWGFFRVRIGAPEPLVVPWRRVVVLTAVQLGFVALSCLGAHQHGLVGLVFVSVTFLYLVRSPRVLGMVLACAVATAVVPRVVPGWEPEDGNVAAVVLASLAVYGFLQLVDRNRQLVAAQQEVAALAVARERDRIARDVHDVLGHSLTVVSLKTELAARLVTTDPERAAAELHETQVLVRSVLADVRGTVAAIHRVSLAGELAAARQALDAAGIDARVPNAVDAVPEDLRELFAWTVREATTNVIRHSGASRVAVTIAPDRVVVEDDGRGPGAACDEQPEAQQPEPHGSPGTTPGHGLRGLAERAASVGAVLEVGPSALGGFRLAVRRPAAVVAGERA